MPSRAVTPSSATPLAVAVGSGFKRVRVAAGATLNDVAKQARGIGLRWTASKVSDFEAGRSMPSLATVIAATQALSMATGQAVSLSDLISEAGPIAVTETLHLAGASITGALCGGSDDQVEEQRNAAVRRTEKATQMLADSTGLKSIDSVRATLANTGTTSVALLVQLRSGLDEQRLAKRLNVSVQELAQISARLWGRSFSDERDRRAGGQANAQKRGQVSRVLQKELRTELGLN